MSEVDPEVERLARVMHDGETEQGGRNENHPFGEGICLNEWEYGGTCRDLWTQQAAAILADLRERYILVPRMSWGFQPTQEWPPEVTSAPLSAQNGPDDSQEGK